MPFEARFGNETFVVSTGVPQGSIMARSDLSLRLDGAGGYRIRGGELSNLHSSLSRPSSYNFVLKRGTKI
jgi:hypothetical protein